MVQPRVSQYPPKDAYVWYVIFLLFVVNVFNYMDRMALAVLLPQIKKDLALSDGQLGLLLGFSFSVFYAVCGIPIARLADRGVRRNIIAVSLTIWSAMTALIGATQNFWQLFAARVGVGAAEAGCIPPAQSLICDYVPLRQRSGMFAIHNFGVYAGMMAGLLLAGWLGDFIGWRLTFVALGVPGIALALIVRLTMREPARGSFDAENTQKSRLSLGAIIIVLWKCKTYRALLVFYVVNGFVQYGMNQWWPSQYVRTFGMSLSEAGFSLGIAIGAGAGIGALIGGLSANKAARRNIAWPLLIGATAAFLAIPAVISSLLVQSQMVSILLVGLTVALWNVCAGPVVATAVSVVVPQIRATAAAVSILATSVLGFGLGPFCVGLLSDLLTPEFGQESLRYALFAPVCLIPLMVAMLYIAAKALPADLRAMNGQLEMK